MKFVIVIVSVIVIGFAAPIGIGIAIGIGIGQGSDVRLRVRVRLRLGEEGTEKAVQIYRRSTHCRARTGMESCSRARWLFETAQKRGEITAQGAITLNAFRTS